MRSNPATASSTNKLVEDKIKSWLRQARDRDGGRKRRFLVSENRNSAAKRCSFQDLPTDDSAPSSDVDSDVEPPVV